MGVANQKGNVITYVIIAMSMIAALSVGALYMTSSSALGELGANNLNRAYFLAMAGKDYALVNTLPNTAGTNFTLSNSDKFRLVISGNTITSTGIVNEGTPLEAKKTISVTVSGSGGFGSQADVSFAKDIADFAAAKKESPGPEFIHVDQATSQISLGKFRSNRFGSVWYSGGAVQGNCTGGKCSFGPGFRAFFVFQFDAGSSGDGFTFAFFNGVENNINSVGGANGWGELMGYAGDSRIDSAGNSFLDGQGGRGIQPPKIAIEFDPWANTGTGNFCVGNVFNPNQRGDGSRSHIAYVFWGDDTSYCGSTVGKNTFDDNRHGVPASSTPSNPQNARSINTGGIDTTSYFRGDNTLPQWPNPSWPSDWLLNNTPTNIYAVRIEVTRSTTQNGGNYDYTIKSWVKQCPINDLTCPAYDDQSDFANTKINYNAVAPADIATLNRLFSLTTALHQKFESFYFGWTAATGGATQNVTMSRFRISFSK
jgi:hypothetical protein